MDRAALFPKGDGHYTATGRGAWFPFEAEDVAKVERTHVGRTGLAKVYEGLLKSEKE